MDGPEIARRLGLATGLLLNDFEAQALSLPSIPEDGARNIGPLGFGAGGPQAILGPGTGLGVGALIEAGGRHTPLPSELCHIGFGPESDEEWAIWPHLERAHGRITTESVISGPGLVRVHRARLAAAGLPASDADGPTIVAAALAGREGEEARSLRLFWRIVGRLAGDVAVTFVAFGGVTLAGGVLPRILDFLDEAAFRRAFEAKAPVDGLARRIPTRLVIRSDTVLLGMAAIAARPESYAIDYATRGWT
jgi:glucokinase